MTHAAGSWRRDMHHIETRCEFDVMRKIVFKRSSVVGPKWCLDSLVTHYTQVQGQIHLFYKIMHTNTNILSSHSVSDVRFLPPRQYNGEALKDLEPTCLSRFTFG